MQLTEWRAVERKIDAEQAPDGPALIDRLPRTFVESLSPLEALALKHDPRAYLRARQLPPTDPDWLCWCLVTGRSWGKSFAAAGWLIAQILACTPAKPRDYMLVAPRLQDCEDLQWSVVESLLPPFVRAVPRTSHQQVLFPDQGVRVFFHSADNVHARGKNLAGLWAEEVIAWPGGGKALWSNLMRSLRVPGPNGEPARAVITTTPPFELTHWLLPVLAHRTTRTTRGTARDNPRTPQANLDLWYAENTAESRRENDGAFVFGVDGALFTIDQIERDRVSEAPPLDTVVVAIDPAMSDGADADNVGGAVLGFAHGHGYLLASFSERLSPAEWPSRALALGDAHGASQYIVEATGAGQTAKTLLMQQARIDGTSAHVTESKAKGSKAIRLGPVANAAKNGRLHVVGHQADFEREATTWHPGARFSPGSLDALAHAWAVVTNYGLTTRL